MPDITVTQELVDNYTEMGVDDIGAYLKNKSDQHENQKIEKEWNKLTIEEKKNKLTAVAIEK